MAKEKIDVKNEFNEPEWAKERTTDPKTGIHISHIRNDIAKKREEAERKIKDESIRK